MRKLWCVLMILALCVSCTRQEAPQAQEQRAPTETAKAPAPAMGEETPPETVSAPVEKIAGNTKITSFKRAKNLAPQVYAERQLTFYCGCAYDGAKKEDQVDHASCGYTPKTTSTGGIKRSKRREWEHIVPAENFGRSFVAWRDGHPECVGFKTVKDETGTPVTNAEGEVLKEPYAFQGRQCAQKVEPVYRVMEGDLYNLVPAIGELNARRRNNRMAEISGEEREHGACDVEIADGQFEPRDEVKGDVARIYFYMEAAYPKHARLSRRNRQLFAAWAKADPVDDWERERGRRIAEMQGNSNPFIQ